MLTTDRKIEVISTARQQAQVVIQTLADQLNQTYRKEGFEVKIKITASVEFHLIEAAKFDRAFCKEAGIVLNFEEDLNEWAKRAKVERVIKR